MKKEIIINVDDIGNYKISRFIRILDTKNKEYKVYYKGKYYKKESKDKKIRQITQLVEALNIKDKMKRLEYVYDKACDILDEDFYGKNVCKFKDNSCMQDRLKKEKTDGCCRCHNNKEHCIYLVNHRCTIRCMACKFHICACLKKLGFKYSVNDITVLKYLLNWKQKIIIYLDFFQTKEEVLKDIYKNSLIIWAFKKDRKNFINDGK